MQQIAGFILSILVDTSFSWMRMLVALFFSVIISIFVGIYAATNKTAEKAIIPVLDVFQTLPILAFFPFVIFVVVTTLPGYIGINAAVIFLIITSMVWNITFGVYEAIRTIPLEFLEVGSIFNLRSFEKFRKILIPAAMPKVVEQSMLSWSIGLFYLVTSEIFSTGNAAYQVQHGIGVALTTLAFSGNYFEYLVGIAVFIIFVIITRLTLFRYLKNKFTRYTVQERRHVEETNPSILKASLEKIARPFSMVKLDVIHRNIVSVRNRFARPLVIINDSMPKMKMPKRINWSGYRHLAYAAIILLMIYAAYSYRALIPTYAGYEYTVLLSLLASLARVWFAFFVILAISLPVGVYLVFMTRKSDSYMLLFQIIASIPATILLPIIVLSLKGVPYHNEIVAFVVFALSGIWYIIFSIVSNRNTIPTYVDEVRNIFSVKGRNAWKEIYLKAILPGLITGSITAIAAEWNASIVAERFTTSAIGSGTVITSVNVGLGKLLDTSLGSGNMPLMVLGLINLTIVILLFNKLFWKRTYNRVLTPYR